MGMLIPVFLAVLLNGMGYLVFREPKEVGPGPLMSSYIFMAACFFLLWDMRLYPKSLRKLGFLPQAFVEYLVTQFLIEHLVIDFWFPLEVGAISVMPKIAESLEDMMSQGGWTCEGLCDILKGEKAGYIVSYFLSIFFLLSVLHASRAVDLRELKAGPVPFFKDIYNRVKLYFKRLLRKSWLMKFFAPKKKLTFQDAKKQKPCQQESRTPCSGGNGGGGGFLSGLRKGRYSGCGNNSSGSGNGNKETNNNKPCKKRCEDQPCYRQSYHDGDNFNEKCHRDDDGHSISSSDVDDYDVCDVSD